MTGSSILPIRKVDGAKYAHMFDMIQRQPENRVLHLRAQSQADYDGWISAFSNINTNEALQGF